jgi:hypothetical protein
VTPLDRDASSVDALLTDLYIDAILAGRSLRGEVRGDSFGNPASAGSAASEPAGASFDRLDPAVRAATERLRQDLVRVHPSFRFEERLATRLAEAAMQLRMPTAVGAEDHVIPFRSRSARAAADRAGGDAPATVDELLADLGSPPDDERRDLARPLLIGGALTSAALSLAGAALVAWRRTRPGSPMARAARAVRDARDTAAATGHLPIGSRRLD